MDTNKPQVPTLGSTKDKKDDKKGGPLLKIRGMASQGGTLLERLKQFKKKDLAFILAGLGVLFMAPLAEHFMMAPDNGDDSLKPGFSRGAGNIFGSGGSPYETGVNGMAPGGVAGGGSDVITPLNVRDPSALVMGPGQTQQAPAGAPQASAPPPPSDNSSKWNDAVSAAKAGAGAAAHSAGLPVPRVPLSAGGLRVLGAISGGSGASFGLPPINSNGLAPNRGVQSNSLTGTNGSGIKGVARGPGTGAGGSFEKLKQNANAQGGDLNRGGAASALEQAANRDMSGTVGGGAGEGTNGDKDKGPSGSQTKDSKSTGDPCGGSLSQKLACQDAEKALDLKWKLKEKQAMLWPNLKEKMLEEAVMTPLKAVTGAAAGSIKDALTPQSAQWQCGPKTGVPLCASDGSSKGGCVDPVSNMYTVGGGTPGNIKCTKGGGSDDAAPDAKAGNVVGGPNRQSNSWSSTAASCNDMKQMRAAAPAGARGSNNTLIARYTSALNGNCTAAQEAQRSGVAGADAAVTACCN